MLSAGPFHPSSAAGQTSWVFETTALLKQMVSAGSFCLSVATTHQSPVTTPNDPPAGFNLEKNSLTGKIPSQLGQLSDLAGYFILKSNELCGTIPEEVAALSSTVTVSAIA